MSLIKDILFCVESDCITEFTTSARSEGLPINQIEIYSTSGLGKFGVFAENIAPYLKPTIEVVRRLTRIHKKKVIFELQKSDGTIIRHQLDSFSKDESIEIMNEAVRLSIQVLSDDRT